MADETVPASASPLLRGLFGVFQQSAAAHADTAQIWQDLRVSAGTWQAQAQGLPQPYDPADLEAAGREILRGQGINAATVSSMRGVAGQWNGAKQRLQARDPGEQIMASDIFTPPWARTDTDVVPSRFRVRTQWQITPTDGNVFTRWKADEITGPLTNIEGLLSQAEPDASTQSGQQILSGNEPPVLVDYELEQI